MWIKASAPKTELEDFRPNWEKMRKQVFGLKLPYIGLVKSGRVSVPNVCVSVLSETLTHVWYSRKTTQKSAAWCVDGSELHKVFLRRWRMDCLCCPPVCVGNQTARCVPSRCYFSPLFLLLSPAALCWFFQRLNTFLLLVSWEREAAEVKHSVWTAQTLN